MGVCGRRTGVIMKYYKKINGEKLYLSPVNTEDAELYTKWVNDYDVGIYMGFYREMISLAKERSLLEGFESGGHSYAIVARDGDVPIGTCGIMSIDQISRNAEVGILIGEADYRGRGYGTEAMKLLVDYGFNALNLRNIMLKVHADNERAYASYVKAGFREFGRRSGGTYKDGNYVDVICMEILNES